MRPEPVSSEPSLRWVDVERFLCDSATVDIADTGEIAPCFVAFAGDEPLVAAYLRPFPKGGYAEPLIELAALAVPLGADRIAVAFGARAWSLDDPVPPVLPEVDLRQRVIAVHMVDGSGGAVRTTGTLLPFEEVAGGLRWGDPVRADEPEGWITDALAVIVRGRDTVTASTDEIAAQAARCVALGHEVHLTPDVHRRLGSAC